MTLPAVFIVLSVRLVFVKLCRVVVVRSLLFVGIRMYSTWFAYVFQSVYVRIPFGLRTYFHTQKPSCDTQKPFCDMQKPLGDNYIS